MKNLEKLFLSILVGIFAFTQANATGEPSTYFNIYVPPSNVSMGRDVCLIVTALYDSTTFTITDDGADGDTDDTKTGMLMQGQSYVLFIRNNGVNDDAPHSGESATKNDGDYFIITSDKLVFASQATSSDWQHDWVSSFNKSSKGQKFIVYSNATSSSANDINVFAYEDSTEVVVRKISTVPLLGQGYTNVNLASDQIVLQQWLNVGQDLIYSNSGGRNILQSGCTYMIESNKPVTVQYGALYQNERDGGGYVPSSNGSSSGDLFYFAVPYQASNEQEVRIVSWDDGNTVYLERYNAGTWVSVTTFTGVDRFKPVQWVGATAGQTFATVFRVRCTEGKRVSVFEANWLETGSPATSDIATMVSSENGTSSGNDFVVYMPPPSNQNNMTNPFTGLKLSQSTHAYVYASDSTVVTVTDCYTAGVDLNRTYTIPAGRYADVNLTMSQWQSIYNGTGSVAGGAERPYLFMHATKPVSVMVANTNDNWLMYFGSSLPQSYRQTSVGSASVAQPGDTVTVTTSVEIGGGSTVTGVNVSTTVTEGATPVSSVFTDATSGTSVSGTMTVTDGEGTTISYSGISSLDSSHNYALTTSIVMNAIGTDETAITNYDIVSVETAISGTVNGSYQQSSSSVGIANRSANTSNYHFSQVTTGAIVTDAVNSWNSCWTDINGDYYPDLLSCSYNNSQPNYMYQNNGNGTFTRVYKGDITAAKTVSSISGVFADLDNDGVDECITSNNLDKATFVFKKNASGNYNKISAGALSTNIGYGQTVNVVDYDNDGLVDVFIAEYFPSNVCRLYHNDGSCQFSRVNTSEISKIANYTIGSTWADYDNDGLPDLFIPVGGTVSNPLSKTNLLYHNDGGGRFTRITTGTVVTDEGNATASAWGDYDNDGYVDLFVSNASMQHNCLYHNNGNGTFTKVDTGAIVNTPGNWHGCSWVDYDNDGLLDMYVLSNDSTTGKRLYHNEGGGYFRNEGNEILCAKKNKTMSAIWADYNRDGYQDVYVSSAAGAPNCLYRNNGGSNHWMSIRLVGTASNKNGIGASVSLKCTGPAGAFWQTRQVGTTAGIGAQSMCYAVFGMGTASIADSVIVRWPSGMVQVVTAQSADQFLQLTEPSSSLVSGKVFVDADSDCSYDAGETGIANVRLHIMPGDILVNTDNSGNYSVRLPLGTYTIERVATAMWGSYCSSTYTVTVSVLNSVYPGNDFACYAAVPGANMSVNTGAAVFRRGFKNDMLLSYANSGAYTASGVSVALTFPAGVVPSSAQPAWSSVAGNTYYWAAGDVVPGGNGAIRIKQVIPLSYAIGDTLAYTAQVTTETTDNNVADDTYYYARGIMGAIDPNQITVLPQGEGEKGYVTDSQVLHYTVEFENLGTYEAAMVSISDTLPEGLETATFQMEHASHSCHFQLQDGKLSVVFEDIHLPCRRDDSDNCTGFVTFSVMPRDGIFPDTRIPNSADIIFDYEVPVNTGRVLNTIYPESLLAQRNRLFVYPNPVVRSCTISAKDYISGIVLTRAMLLDINGRVQADWVVSGTVPEITISNALKQGNYVLKAYDINGREYMALISLQRP